MDYRDLLIRYMCHVGIMEGTYFTGSLHLADDMFTDEQIKELEQISKESDELMETSLK